MRTAARIRSGDEHLVRRAEPGWTMMRAIVEPELAADLRVAGQLVFPGVISWQRRVRQNPGDHAACPPCRRRDPLVDHQGRATRDQRLELVTVRQRVPDRDQSALGSDYVMSGARVISHKLMVAATE